MPWLLLVAASLLAPTAWAQCMCCAGGPFDVSAGQCPDAAPTSANLSDACTAIVDTLFGNRWDVFGNFSLRDNGSLLLTEMNITVAEEDYCLVGRSDLAVVAMAPAEPLVLRPKQIIYATGVAVSLPCLLATFLVHALSPDLRNLHGKCVMSHAVSMFFAYLFMALIHLTTIYVSDEVCTAYGFLQYYFFIAAFLWLNVMCIGIWLTFRKATPSRHRKEAENARFIYYSLYSWGVPFLLVIIVLLSQYCRNTFEGILLYPGIGDRTCWFNGLKSHIAYFYSVVGTLMIVNLTIFIVTTKNIIGIKKQTKMVQDSNSQKRKREKFMLYLKLFVIMGVPWLLEIPSWFTPSLYQYIWIPADLINALQGVGVFVIFVCKRRVLEPLRQKFCKSWKTPIKTDSQEHTRGSQDLHTPNTISTTLSSTGGKHNEF